MAAFLQAFEQHKAASRRREGPSGSCSSLKGTALMLRQSALRNSCSGYLVPHMNAEAVLLPRDQCFCYTNCNTAKSCVSSRERGCFSTCKWQNSILFQ